MHYLLVWIGGVVPSIVWGLGGVGRCSGLDPCEPVVAGFLEQVMVASALLVIGLWLATMYRQRLFGRPKSKQHPLMYLVYGGMLGGVLLWVQPANVMASAAGLVIWLSIAFIAGNVMAQLVRRH